MTVTTADIADYIEKHGHAVGRYQDKTGAVCVMRAFDRLLIAAPVDDWNTVHKQLEDLVHKAGFTRVIDWSDATPTDELLKQLRGQT